MALPRLLSKQKERREGQGYISNRLHSTTTETKEYLMASPAIIFLSWIFSRGDVSCVMSHDSLFSASIFRKNNQVRAEASYFRVWYLIQQVLRTVRMQQLYRCRIIGSIVKVTWHLYCGVIERGRKKQITESTQLASRRVRKEVVFNWCEKNPISTSSGVALLFNVGGRNPCLPFFRLSPPYFNGWQPIIYQRPIVGRQMG